MKMLSQGIIFILSLHCLAVGVLSQNNGQIIQSSLGRRLSRARAASTVSCENKFGPVCADCNTLLTCVGADPPVLTQNCGTYYPGQPYCVKDACTNELGPESPQCSSGIRCTAEGYFPNPTNCSQYYQCTGPLGDSLLYECPNGFVYNPPEKNCKRRVAASDCVTINCAANPNLYVVYPGDRGYYAFCLTVNGVLDPIMFRCDDPINFQYSQAQRRCIFQCRAEGRVADIEDCQKYYECFKVGATYISRQQSCIRGYIYNDTVKQCVKGSCAPPPPPPPPPSDNGNGGAGDGGAGNGGAGDGDAGNGGAGDGGAGNGGAGNGGAGNGGAGTGGAGNGGAGNSGAGNGGAGGGTGGA